MTMKYLLLLLVIATFSACSSKHHSQKQQSSTTPDSSKGTFGSEVNLLKKYTNVIVLSDPDSSGQVLVTPKMQGRVMTSTTQGDNGKSLGWVNNKLIASGKTTPHMTAYGGEDRFWIGPEGGQFSIFIKPGKKFIFKNWFTPAAFNTEPWQLVSHSDSTVEVKKDDMQLFNYSHFKFNVDVKRTIKLLNKSHIEQLLNIQIPNGIHSVGYESINTMTNAGNKPWKRKTGGLFIWILSQFAPAPGVTVAIPFKKGSKEKLGSLETFYFGKISKNRQKIDKNDGVIYFKMDGKKRRKLGLSPKRSKGVEGSYDETNHVLTLMTYSHPVNNDTTAYMNNLWKHQKHPYVGDVEFAYNDGPLKDGSQLGPFFEMESASPAAFLSPGDSIEHTHRIFHFSGNEQKLSKISQKVLGVSIEQIKAAF
jgi:hypothetical protein